MMDFCIWAEHISHIIFGNDVLVGPKVKMFCGNHGTELNGAPIIGMIDGGAAELIREADCGLSVNAGDYNALAELIIDKVLQNKDEFAKKGENGRLFFEVNFTLDGCIYNLITLIEDVRSLVSK